MSGLGAELSAIAAVATGAGVAGALAAAVFISADEADDDDSCLLQATEDIINAITTVAVVRDSAMRRNFMLGSIVNAPRRANAATKNLQKNKKGRCRERPSHELAGWIWNVAIPPLLPTASGRCRNSSTHAGRRRSPPALRAGESWCPPDVLRAWYRFAEPYQFRQRRA